MNIHHKTEGSKGKFFIEESGKVIAELTYSIASPNMIIIDHTEVSDKIAGKGAGKELVRAAAEFARENKIKIFPLCPFANAIMQRNKEYQDILIKQV